MHHPKHLHLILASTFAMAMAAWPITGALYGQEQPRLWGEPLEKPSEPLSVPPTGEPRDSSPSAASGRGAAVNTSPAQTAASTPAPGAPEKPESIWKNRKSAWNGLGVAERTSVDLFSQDYRRFLGEARTELMAVAEVRKRAEARGFRLWTPDSPIMPGDRLIFVERDRSLILARVGSRPMSDGVRISATHIDSPRIELKGRPFYQAQDLVLFQTTYHGGIKKYQWVNVPLALVGRITRRDGTSIDVRLGLEADDPVFLIPDTAPHEDKELRERKQNEVIKGEELDPIVGSYPDGASPLASLLARVKEQYQIDEEDLVGAELSLVPAHPPREVGFDRSMVGAYGQDDKACSFAAVRALLDQESTPGQTTLVYLSDNEEVGSNNNTGADSFFLRSVLEQLSAGRSGTASPGAGYQMMARSLAISADTTTGVNPLFSSTQEESNASRLGFGVVIKLYGNGNNASTETTALVRRLLYEQHIPWQTQTPRVDVGGGGTIGNFLSRMGMDVIDMGIPVLSQHSPFELSSKVDVYNLYQTLVAFNNGAPAGSAYPEAGSPAGASSGERSPAERPSSERSSGGGAAEPARPVLHPYER